ncbi:hypothetical protein JAAARDRAFT_31966 [Jaapia argillacea MUCL 33604]|uniref:Uncharacterized protein n=1 Tax=Jaapia argillacea MUCL 33604 TaxID=933084 RepID=A0A067Q4B2_9AGAM|nr:hypothetical protein JAAARDRAFT_31966 [Jaapia argillacea MUCL 33604]
MQQQRAQRAFGPYVPPHNSTTPLADPQMGSKGVNDLLHTLRGEQFRHSQNLRRTRAHLLPSHISNTPSLPLEILHASQGLSHTGESFPPPQPTVPTNVRPFAGPGPPKSWIPSSQSEEFSHESALWRARALSVIFSRLPFSSTLSTKVLTNPAYSPSSHPNSTSVPPLTLLCLRIILSDYLSSDDFTEDLVLSIPPHLRRDLLRYTTIHYPLPSAKLFGLCEPDGHADGELIVVGPSASLQSNHFRTHDRPQREHQDGFSEGVEIAIDDLSWDSPATTLPPPFHTLILLSTPLPLPSIPSLPATLTHVALLSLPSPIPIHRLPMLCPLLVVLDLSFNSWIREVPAGLKRVDWGRWRRLEILGLRGGSIRSGGEEYEQLRVRVNKGRWADVEIVVDDHVVELQLD